MNGGRGGRSGSLPLLFVDLALWPLPGSAQSCAGIHRYVEVDTFVTRILRRLTGEFMCGVANSGAEAKFGTKPAEPARS